METEPCETIVGLLGASRLGALLLTSMPAAVVLVGCFQPIHAASPLHNAKVTIEQKLLHCAAGFYFEFKRTLMKCLELVCYMHALSFLMPVHQPTLHYLVLLACACRNESPLITLLHMHPAISSDQSWVHHVTAHLFFLIMSGTNLCVRLMCPQCWGSEVWRT